MSAVLERLIPVYSDPSGRDGRQLLDHISEEDYLRRPEPLYLPNGREIPRIAGGSFVTGTSLELIYASTAAGTAKASFTTEIAINDTAGMGAVAHLPADFWLPRASSVGTGFRVVARGILSSTVTPTYTFTVRLGTQGNITAAIALGSAALTTGSGVTNQMWEFQGDVILTTLGAAGTNSTVRGIGLLACGGLASPFSYALFGGAASPGTVATVDTTIVNYINFNVACSASNASNTITLQQLLVFGF